MPFYGFRFDFVKCLNPRGKVPDSDIITFVVYVNEIARGSGVGLFPSLTAETNVPAAAVRPTKREHMDADWIVGPLRLQSGDRIRIIYTGTNTSDSRDLDAEREQIKVLDFMLSTAVGFAGGPLGAVAGAVLSAFTSPAAAILGWKADGPCNGLVFAGAADFNAEGISHLDFQAPFGPPFRPRLPLDTTELRFTRTETDEISHDTETCGMVAHTEIGVSIIRAPSISVRYLAERRFGRKDWSKGLRGYMAGKASVLHWLWAI